jgi:hypothetical protein
MVLTHPHALHPLRLGARDHAVSALLKIFVARGFPLDPLLPFFPLTADLVEARFAHSLLLHATEGQNSPELDRVRAAVRD